MSDNEESNTPTAVDKFDLHWIGSRGLSTFGAETVVLFIALAQGVVVARVLGPEGKGVIALVTLGLALPGSLLGLGLGLSTQYHVSARAQQSGFIVAVVVFFALGTGALIGVLLTGASNLFSQLFLNGMAEGPHFVELAALMAPALLLHQLLFPALIAGNLIMARIIVRLGTGFLTLGLVLFFVLILNQGIGGAITAIVLGTWTGAVAIAGLAIWRFGFSLRWEGDTFRSLFSYGLRHHVSVVAVDSFKRLDIFLLSYFFGAGPVGLYTVAQHGSDLVLRISTSINSLALSAFSNNPMAVAARWAARISRGLMAAMLLVGVAAGVAGFFAIPLIYGELFRAAVVPYLVLLMGMVTVGPAASMAVYQQSQRRPGVVSIFLSVTLLVNLLIGLLLIPFLGALGNAIARSSGRLVHLLLQARRFHSDTGIPYAELVTSPREEIASLQRLLSRITISRRPHSQSPN